VAIITLDQNRQKDGRSTETGQFTSLVNSFLSSQKVQNFFFNSRTKMKRRASLRQKSEIRKGQNQPARICEDKFT